MTEPNYYDILQVSPNAEPGVIEAAYKRLAFTYHPDRNSDPAAQQKMRMLNEAYEVLSDPQQRAAYDARHRSPPIPRTRAQPSVESPAEAPEPAGIVTAEWESQGEPGKARMLMASLVIVMALILALVLFIMWKAREPEATTTKAKVTPRKAMDTKKAPSTRTKAENTLDTQHAVERPKTMEVHRSKTVGGGGGEPLENIGEQGAFLTGFAVMMRSDEIAFLQPIYTTADGKRILASGFGHANDATAIPNVEAKAGYAIGGLLLWSNPSGGLQLVRGIKIQFMRRHDHALDPKDSYWSEWIGLNGEGKAVMLGGDGKPIIGIHGRAGGAIDSLGIISLQPVESQPKKSTPPGQNLAPTMAKKESDWVDVSKGPAQLGDVRVKVGWVVLGNVKIKNDMQGEVRISDNKYLCIQIFVQNMSEERTLNYRGWSGVEVPGRDGAAAYAAGLTDEYRNVYKRIKFDLGSYVIGQVVSDKSIYPNESAEDLLVFEPPVDKAKFLRLELPAAGYHGAGALRIQIPTAAIRR